MWALIRMSLLPWQPDNFIHFVLVVGGGGGGLPGSRNPLSPTSGRLHKEGLLKVV